jgi:hypothetical protein
MTQLGTIKDLTHMAVDLLEMSYFSPRLDASRSSAPRIRASGALASQHRELITFCKSPRQPGALVLANLVCQLALERRIPSVMVTARCSPVVFVLILLLWRADIALEETVSPAWGEHEFARLTAAAREVASAPLLVINSATFVTRRILLTVAADCRRCRVIIDAGAEPVGRLVTLSRTFDVPTTIVSLTCG